MNSLSFSSALIFLKNGSRIARAGWNGKDMWLSLTPGQSVHADKFWSQHNRAFAMGQSNREVEVLPYITMKTADDKIVPWLASQTDILAEDWIMLEDL